MLTIDPRYVDYDFRTDPQFVPGDLAPPDARFEENPFFYGFQGYGEVYGVLSEAERTQQIERLDAEGGIERLVRWILNQRREGACVGFAQTQAQMTCGAKQFGEANIVHLSGVSAYQPIGRSPNSGAMVSDALEKGQQLGVIPLDTPDNRQRFGSVVMPENGFYTKRPQGWEQVAAQFRIAEYLVIRNVAELEQAGINGHPIVVGRSGHSICYLRPSLRSGRGFLYVNSWGGWGFGAGGHTAGFGFDSSRLVSSSARWAFAVCSVTTPDYLLAA